MRELVAEIPSVDVFLELQPEELSAKILLCLRQRGQNRFHRDSLEGEFWNGHDQNSPRYPRERDHAVGVAFREAWAWMEAQGLLIPESGVNGQNGFRCLSRRAERIESDAQFADFQAARLLPRETLNPRMADVVWQAFMRAQFDVAVFQAMKAVEVAVREASGLGDHLIGVRLMREAFALDGGALTDMAAERGENQGRMDLFAGAVASYKNPHSHRDVNLNSPHEAMEIIFLANHLLRIVDSRVAANEAVG